MPGLLILATVAQLSQFVTSVGAGIRRHYCIEQLPDGGYACSGNLIALGYRFILCRFDRNGNLLWYYNIHRTSKEDRGHSFTKHTMAGSR